MTNFDIIVSVIVLIFITFGLFKGGIGSVLSMFKWYGAFIVSMILYPHAKEMVSQIIQPSVVVNAVSIIGIYVAALIVLSIINGVLSVAFTAIVGNIIDKILGIIIGTLIGVIIVCSVHFGVNSAFGGNDPDWLKAGQTYDLTKAGSDLMKEYLNGDASKMAEDLGMKLGAKAEDNQSGAAEALKNVAQDAVDNAPSMEALTPDKIREIVRKLKAQGFSEQEVIQMIKDGKYNTEATVQETIEKSQ